MPTRHSIFDVVIAARNLLVLAIGVGALLAFINGCAPRDCYRVIGAKGGDTVFLLNTCTGDLSAAPLPNTLSLPDPKIEKPTNTPPAKWEV